MPDAVTDTGPFIHLDEIQQLEVLTAVFNTILVPEQVIREISNLTVLSFIEQHPEVVHIEQVQVKDLFTVKDSYHGFRLHPADLAIVVLLCKYDHAVAITDDLELRKAIESSGRTVVGTIGVLFRCFQLGVFDKEQLQNSISNIFNDSSLYLSSAFKKRVLEILNAHTSSDT
jgi:predicted nucleic acid-binding protein